MSTLTPSAKQGGYTSCPNLLLASQGTSVARQCSLLYGVTAVMSGAAAHTVNLVEHGIAASMDSGILRSRKDRVVVIIRVSGPFSGATVQLTSASDHYTGEKEPR